MSTVIRAEISTNNPYWISKHRYYELKHFCLQYPSWKKLYSESKGSRLVSSVSDIPSDSGPGDPTGNSATIRAYYSELIEMVERAAMDTDRGIYEYIIKGVTEGRSYTYLKTAEHIPCGRDFYYEKYRRFFWILSNLRD